MDYAKLNNALFTEHPVIDVLIIYVLFLFFQISPHFCNKKLRKVSKFHVMSTPVIGEVAEICGSVLFHWKIREFSSLPEEVGNSIRSPTFCFSGASWYIEMYPNGRHSQDASSIKERSADESQICLFLMRGDHGPALAVQFIIKLENVDTERILSFAITETFVLKDSGWGRLLAVARTVIEERNSGFAPEDTVTVTMKLIHGTLQKVQSKFSVVKKIIFLMTFGSLHWFRLCQSIMHLQ